MRTRRLFPITPGTAFCCAHSAVSSSTSTSSAVTTMMQHTSLTSKRMNSASATTSTTTSFDNASSESIVASLLGGDNNNSQTTSTTKKQSPELLKVLMAANNLASIKGALITDSANLKSATRVFTTIADGYLDKIPVVILTRLLSKKWPREVLSSELEMKMRREVYDRCGDLRKGDEIAEILVRWSIRPDHAADLGMFRKLGKLLAYHITTVDSSINLLQALRALRRARIKPPPQFLETVSRRMVVLLSRGVDFENKTENHQNEYDEENGNFRCKDSVQVLRLFKDFYGTSDVAVPDHQNADHKNNASSTPTTTGIPLPLVIGCLRIAAARIEKKLLDLEVISPSTAPDLLNEGVAVASAATKINNDTSGKEEETPSASTTKPLSSRDAIKILAQENITPLQLIFLLTHMTNNRITTLKYTRPFALLIGGLVSSTAPSVVSKDETFRLSHRDFVSLLVPVLARFPIQRFAGCNEVSSDWSRLVIKQLNEKIRLCNWEELIYASQFVVKYTESRQSEIDNTLSETEREALTTSSGLGDTKETNIIVPFFEHVAESLASFGGSSSSNNNNNSNNNTTRTAPSSWQTMLLARWMQRGARADPGNLEQLMKEKFMPPIINRSHHLMEKGLIPLKHYEHLMETLTLANLHQTPEAEKLRALRKTITEDNKPYSERFGEGFSLWKSLRSFNETQIFGDMPNQEEVEVLRKFVRRELLPRHPLYLLKVLHEFDTSFPHVLQPALRREFAFVFEKHLTEDKAREKFFPSSSTAPNNKNSKKQQVESSTQEQQQEQEQKRVDESTENNNNNSSESSNDAENNNTAVIENSKKQLREFVDLFWKSAPTTCKTSKTIWKSLSKQAEKLGDEALAKKSNQIHDMLVRLKL